MAAHVSSVWSPEAIAALIAAASSSGLLIHVSGTLKVDIDGFQTTLHYQQTDLRVLIA